MPKTKLTASLEDYLEALYNHIEANQSVKAIDISKELNVSRASVTEALKKLEQQGLIHYGRYDSIAITNDGAKKAKEVIKKHKILNEFFADILNLPPEQASLNACRIEHVITQDAFDKLIKFVDFCKKEHEYTQKFKNY